MKVLLDTQVLIWWLDDHPALNDQAREAIADPQNNVCASAASLWEIAIKHRIGKFPLHPGVIQAGTEKSGIGILHIKAEHAIRIANLPMFDDQRDPFDRMLIAQALIEDLTLVTADAKIRDYQDAYGLKLLWARR